MAKKRASLKGKGVTGSGASEEKGKGIDLLFGGVPEEETDSEAAKLVVEVRLEDTDEDDQPPAPAPVSPPPPLPQSRGLADTPLSVGMVDELGLPVAMESPPADLEMAGAALPDLPMSRGMSMARDLPPAELDLTDADFADMPVAMEAPPVDVGTVVPDLPVAVELDDALPPELADMPIAMEAPPPEPEPILPPAVDIPDSAGEADLLGEADQGLVSEVNDNDLAGLAGDSDLTDLAQPEVVVPPVVAPVTPPIIDPVVPAVTPPVVDPVVPVNIPPTDFSTPPPPPSSAPSTVFGPAASTPIPPPSIEPPRARIDSIGGIVTEKIQVVEKDILPEDTKYSGGPVSGVLAVAERAQVEQNELITQRVTRYIGRERREKLDKDIEELYDEVAVELSSHKEDAEFALRTLSQAQDIIFEDARQYDEALYRVALVRTMIVRKRNLRRWSYTWGSAVFFYAVVWLAAFIAGFLFTGDIGSVLDSASSATESVLAVRAAWFSALAGGIGGILGILYSLYWHVAMKQDFDRQYVMYYAVQPIMGFVLGALMYFIIGAGFLVVNFATEPTPDIGEKTASVLSSQVVISLQIVSGLIAGFRMRFVLELIDKIVQRFSSKPDNAETSDQPISVVPADQIAVQLPPPAER